MNMEPTENLNKAAGAPSALNDELGRDEVGEALMDAIDEAKSMIDAEIRGGNVVKENWWRGKLTGLRAAQAMRSNVEFSGQAAALSPRSSAGT